jgi:hypothetical protein
MERYGKAPADLVDFPCVAIAGKTIKTALAMLSRQTANATDYFEIVR